MRADHLSRRFRRPVVALVTALTLGGGSVWTAPAARAGKPTAAATDRRTIVHVLNRMTFGPAPGDVERVAAMGLDAYIEQQLAPGRIDDSALDARLAAFQTVTLSSRDIATRYYLPFEELRRQAQARQVQTKQLQAKEVQAGKTEEAKPADEMMATPSMTPSAPQQSTRADLLEDMSPEDRRRFREAQQQRQLVVSELSEQKLLRAVYSDRQLEEVLVDFWFNHFNVFEGKGLTRWYLTEYERDAIRPHVLGTFRDLLGATAHSPAMLFYLDNWQSSDPNMANRRPNRAPGARRVLDPSRDPSRDPARRPRARPGPRAGEMMDRLNKMPPDQRRAVVAQAQQRRPQGLNENYARELLELHTLGVDGGGYTQQDIIEVAKCFTGWTIDTPRQGGGYRFDERRHVPGPKTVLGKKITAGGERDGEAVLDLLAKHPSTARFIATKLARRFVSDTPPKALVDRAARTFRDTDGDLRAVTRVILLSPEFRSREAMNAKVKTPLEFVASALRITRAEITDADAVVRTLRGMGMPLYGAQPPTGYADRADAWVNTGALINRMNFALGLVNNKVKGVRVDVAQIAGNIDIASARRSLMEAMLADEASDATLRTLEKGTAIPQLAALTLGSPEFQRR